MWRNDGGRAGVVLRQRDKLAMHIHTQLDTLLNVINTKQCPFSLDQSK